MCEVQPDGDSDGQGVLALSKDESPSTNAPLTFGAYRVLHQAGSGILGPVFRALDSEHDRIAAVKVFQLDITPEDAVRVAAELRRLASLPPMVGQPRLFDAGVEGARPFLAMAFHGGETLDVYLRRAAPRPLGDVLPLLVSLSQAIDRAAQTGVHHGALHPRDVIQDPVAPRVWITGFGVRQALQASGVAVPAARRGYVAPEVAARRWDGRADVFSLGAIVHEWLTRKRPAIGGDQDGTLSEDLSPEQRVELRRVLRRALATDPDARFASAGDFVTALQAIVGTELVAEDVSDGGSLEPTVVFAPPADEPPVVPAEPGLIAIPSSAATEVDSHAPDWDLGPGSVAALARPADTLAATISTGTRVSRPPERRGALPWIAAALGGIAVGVAAGSVAAGWWDHARKATRVDAILQPSRTNGDAVVRPPREVVDDTAPPERQVVREDVVPAIVQRGQLTVRSRPAGAMVTVDGRILGETPLVASDMALGAHDVVVARPGHVPRSERVVLLAASPRRTLTVALESGVEVPPVHGTVDVASYPRGARVLVDGRLIGRTPLRVPELAPGMRRVTFELDGYVTMTMPVAVSRGGTHAIRVTMEASE